MQSESIALASPTPNPLEISEPSEAPTSLPAIGLSRAVSPVRIFPSLVKELGWRVSDPASGTSTPELLASYDPDTQSWRTSALSLFEGSIPYSGALPRSGTMRSGRIYAPPMSERRTEGKGFGLWPTPRAQDREGLQAGMRRDSPGLGVVVRMFPTPRLSDAERGGRGDLLTVVRGKPNAHSGPMFPTPSATEYGTNQGGGMGRTGPICPSLGTMARKGLWPTPRAIYGEHPGMVDEGHLTGAVQADGAPSGQLNPTFVEWMMNYPKGWTDLTQLNPML